MSTTNCLHCMIFQPTHGTLLLWWTAYTLRRFWDFVLFSYNMVWRLLRQLFLGFNMVRRLLRDVTTHTLFGLWFWLFWSPLSNAVLVFLWCRCGGRSPRLLFTPLELGATTMTLLGFLRVEKYYTVFVFLWRVHTYFTRQCQMSLLIIIIITMMMAQAL